MRLHSVTISFGKDNAGATKPLQVAHAHFVRGPDDPVEILFDGSGNPRPKKHIVAVDLENCRPEDDANANVSASDASLIKAHAQVIAADGVIAPVVDN